MKIWFDKTSAYQPPGDEYADCTCPAFYSRQTEGELFEDIQTGLFEQSTPLYIRQYDNERWLACHPTGSGKIVVLDQPARFLLEQFQKPRTLFQVMQIVPGRSVETIERAIVVFLRVGILQNVCATAPLYEWIEDESLTVWMHITNACNLRCSYCYLHKTSEHMADDTARRSIDAVFRSAHKHNIKRVKLKYAGGEASLFMPRVIALHDYAAQVAQSYDISLEAILLSNGVVLSQHAIDALKARQIHVMISLDGLEADHDSQRPFLNGRGSSQYVVRTIERLLANALIPRISITVSSRNLEGLPKLMEYVLARDMPFTISYYRENECSAHIRDLRFEEEGMIAAMRSVFEVIERHLPQRSLLGCLLDRTHVSTRRNRTCGVGYNYLVIDQHGGVAKCQEDIKRRITTIEADDPLQFIRDDRDGVQGFSVDDKEGCRACEWRYWCAGGCPLLTYKVTGRYDVKSPNCTIYKALFPDVLRLEAARLLQYVPPIVLEM